MLDKYLYVTFFRPTERWNSIAPDERTALIERIDEGLAGLSSLGIVAHSWSRNSPETDRRAPYDIFCVYEARDADAQRRFEEVVRESGWYDYFDQIAGTGPAERPADVLRGL